MRFKTTVLFLVASALCAPAFAANEEHMHQHTQGTPMAMPLTEPGNDAFAAIQEAVQKLLANPATDWSRVNLEALRQHLIDMNNFTLNVNLNSQKPIDNGVEFTVKPTSPGAAESLGRLFSAHPAVLKQESGWEMKSTKNGDGSYTARVTGKPEDAAKIRGLGYIGLVAYGAHHQEHHWMMATGANPHSH